MSGHLALEPPMSDKQQPKRHGASVATKVLLLLLVAGMAGALALQYSRLSALEQEMQQQVADLRHQLFLQLQTAEGQERRLVSQASAIGTLDAIHTRQARVTADLATRVDEQATTIRGLATEVGKQTTATNALAARLDAQGAGRGTSTPAGSNQPGTPPAAGALTDEQSRLATVTMGAEFTERDIFNDDEQLWSGSGVIVGEQGNNLIVMTNSHCMGLLDIADSEVGPPEVERYGIVVWLSGGGKPIRATQFAETPTKGLDMALLKIPKGTLVKGRDYWVAGITPRQRAAVGDAVVLIGAPLDPALHDTHTFGHVSAIRPPGTVRRQGVLQTDAAMNHGNSGGPCFIAKGGGLHFVGINTFSEGEGLGLNFAYFADEYLSQQWQWYDANPAGAVKALREIYSREATTAP